VDSTPRVLIAVVSCHARPIPRELLRSTWVPRVPQGIDLRFFLGTKPLETGGFVAQNDEVFLQCDDSYNGLPEKVQRIFRWALEQGYDYCMKLDEDVCLLPEQWAKGFLRVDFSGLPNMSQPGYLCPWGFAYVLSRRAMEIVVNSDLPRDNNDEQWVAQTLAPHGVGLSADIRYCLHTPKCNKKRTLRAPPRPATSEGSTTGAFAYCIFIPGDSPEKQAEYMKVWEKTCNEPT